jgi:hypothetical protein
VQERRCYCRHCLAHAPSLQRAAATPFTLGDVSSPTLAMERCRRSAKITELRHCRAVELPPQLLWCSLPVPIKRTTTFAMPRRTRSTSSRPLLAAVPRGHRCRAGHGCRARGQEVTVHLRP